MKIIVFLLFLTVIIVINLSAQGITIGIGTTFALGGATLSLPNNWSNAGIFVPGSGTVVFDGIFKQSIINSSGETFLDLTINKASGEVMLDNNITINGNLTLVKGDLDLNGDTLTLGPSALLHETSGNTVKGTIGVIKTIRTLNANPGNIANLGVDISDCPALGLTTIERGHRPDTIGTSSSIARNYMITPTNHSGLNATVSFYYNDSELNNLTEANLGLFKSIDNGVSWNAVTGTLNTTSNSLTVVGIESFSKWSLFSSINPPTDIDQEKMEMESIPKEYFLSQNYPNPFNPTTSISFNLPKQSHVELRMFDVIGREVAVLVNGYLPAGRYTKTWNASSFTSGVYFYRLNTQQTASSERETFISTKKLLLVK